MARYELRFKRSVAKDLRKIPNDDIKRILQRIDRLADDPRGPGCVKLAAGERYRVRLGVYRIIYEIEDDRFIIQLVKVGHRSTVYRIR
jgi:mRNA interferase RelE/StbE